MNETATAPVSTDAVVVLTEPAARQIATMLAEDKENAGKPLRVYVEAPALEVAEALLAENLAFAAAQTR